MEHRIKLGMTTTFEKRTGSSDAYVSDSSTIDYLVSTPSILSTLIDISSKMLDPLLPSDFITVGQEIRLNHDNPTLVGQTLTFKLTVAKIENNRIGLEFEVHDAQGICCSGEGQRTIVNKNRLLEIAHQRIK